MIRKDSVSGETRQWVLVRGCPVARPESEDDLYQTFLEVRELLELYAPAWYPDTLRERVDALLLSKLH